MSRITELKIRLENEVYVLRHKVLFLLDIFRYRFKGYPIMEAIRLSYADREEIHELEMAKLKAELGAEISHLESILQQGRKEVRNEDSSRTTASPRGDSSG